MTASAMRGSVVLAMACLSLSRGVFAEVPPPHASPVSALSPSSPHAKPPPSAKVDELTYSFGGVSEGAHVKHEFFIKNGGGSDLQIQKVVPSCGCTVSKAEPEIVPPGTQSKLSVEFDSSGFSGVVTKEIRVLTNDPDAQAITFSLRGSVVEDIHIAPQRIIFDGVIKGSSPSQEISVSVGGDSDYKIAGIKAFSPVIVVTPISSNEKNYRATIALSPDAPLGEVRDRVVVSIVGARKGKSLTIPVYAFVKGEVDISPLTVSFGLLTADAPLERSVKVEGVTSKREVIVEKVVSDSPMISATIREIEAKRRYVVKISLDPSKKLPGADTIRGSVEVVTNLGSYSISVFGAFPPE